LLTFPQNSDEIYSYPRIFRFKCNSAFQQKLGFIQNTEFDRDIAQKTHSFYMPRILAHKVFAQRFRLQKLSL